MLENENNRVSHYKTLLEMDDVFREWYENIRIGSAANADSSLRRIGYVCKIFNTNPKNIAGLNQRDATSFVFKVARYLESKNGAPSYVTGNVKVLKSWLAYNGIKLTQKVRLAGGATATTLTEKYENERPPSPSELQRIFQTGIIRTMVACAFLSFSGLRPEVMGDYEGKDGLKIGDLPEL